MKWLVALVLVGSVAVRAWSATCIGACLAVSADVLPRLSLQRPVPCQCGGEVPTNDNWDYLDAHACTDDHPCTVASRSTVVVENITSSTDDYEILLADTGMTLVSVACHCEANCTTTATLAFTDRSGNAIGLTGGGDLACGTGTGNSTFTTFLTTGGTAGNRILVAGEGLRFSTTNSPTTNQRITFTLAYTIP